MTTPTFPSTLPNVLMNSSYGFKAGNTNQRTEMDSGPARVRRTQNKAVTSFTVSWILTLAELGLFEKFYETDCLSGSIWFNISLVNGVGETTYLARFTEPYSVKSSLREFEWSVTATLETFSRPLPA